MIEELEQFQHIYNIIVEFLVKYSFQIVAALVIFMVGLFIAGRIARVTFGVCKKKELDVTLSQFIANIVKLLILAMVMVICLNKLGIEVSPFIAALGAISLGAGLAIQGTLSNYAAGLTIIITRPFVVGNTIKVQGVSGIVKEVRLAHTILNDEDGVEISIPNKHVTGEIIENSFEHTLASGCIGIAYNEDPQKSIKLIEDVIRDCEGATSDPAPQVGISSFADSAIEIEYRYWVPSDRIFKLKYQVNASVYKTLSDKGVTIPFPQREVRMLDGK